MNFILKKISNKRWLFCCLLFFVSCDTKNHYDNYTVSKNDSIKLEQNITSSLDSISRYKNIVKTGDLIVRTGKDFTSETMRLLSTKDKTYSHCGIASIEHDSL
ncbi:MAG: hypothetical protein ACRDE5_04635, partial [Ginsengibacter sp.]